MGGEGIEFEDVGVVVVVGVGGLMSDTGGVETVFGGRELVVVGCGLAIVVAGGAVVVVMAEVAAGLEEKTCCEEHPITKVTRTTLITKRKRNLIFIVTHFHFLYVL